MDGPDKFEELAEHSTFTLALLANETTGDFELVSPGRLPEDALQAFKARDLCLGGLLGVVGGKPESVLEVTLRVETLTKIAAEFGRRYARTITHPTWCMRPDKNWN